MTHPTTAASAVDIKHAGNLLVPNGVQITADPVEWCNLSAKYNIPYREVALIDLNRCGIHLDEDQVRVGFRTRFNATMFCGYDLAWFAMPVRTKSDTNFHISGGEILFRDDCIGRLDAPMLDTCESSYQRGESLLNLNSRSRSNCAGCRACVHNDKSLYDGTVIKDKRELRKRKDIEAFFDQKEKEGLDISALRQIAVVTGLFSNEDDLLNHLKVVDEVAKAHGFCGELMYFGMQLISHRAMREFAKLSNPAIVFAVDNFTRRKKMQAMAKSRHSLKEICCLMDYARSLGIGVTYAYIAGVDSLDGVTHGANLLAPHCSRFPIVNIFQVQTKLQLGAMVNEAKTLEYYLRVRNIFERTYANSELKPRRWENYRPLWYRTFGGDPLEFCPYG